MEVKSIMRWGFRTGGVEGGGKWSIGRDGACRGEGCWCRYGRVYMKGWERVILRFDEGLRWRWILLNE